MCAVLSDRAMVEAEAGYINMTEPEPELESAF
jgi:hypothetical protein